MADRLRGRITDLLDKNFLGRQILSSKRQLLLSIK